MKDILYPVTFKKNDSGFTVSSSKFPDCTATGKTPGEAYQNIRLNIIKHISESMLSGKEIPVSQQLPSNKDEFDGFVHIDLELCEEIKKNVEEQTVKKHPVIKISGVISSFCFLLLITSIAHIVVKEVWNVIIPNITSLPSIDSKEAFILMAIFNLILFPFWYFVSTKRS